MTNRERVKSILHYEDYDKMPLVHFGFWTETLQLWASQGYIRKEIAENWGDGNSFDDEISKILGFDFDWYSVFHPKLGLLPAFENKIIEELPDGTKKILNGEGVITLYRPGAGSIPADVDHLLKDRKSWEQLYLPKLQWNPDRVFKADVRVNGGMVPFEKGGMEFLKAIKDNFTMAYIVEVYMDGSGTGLQWKVRVIFLLMMNHCSMKSLRQMLKFAIKQ